VLTVFGALMIITYVPAITLWPVDFLLGGTP
jgi:TRAP-type C4-dicarboxylate transport system permease large subunit